MSPAEIVEALNRGLLSVDVAAQQLAEIYVQIVDHPPSQEVKDVLECGPKTEK